MPKPVPMQMQMLLSMPVPMPVQVPILIPYANIITKAKVIIFDHSKNTYWDA